jgi:putative endonuclease
MCHVYIIHSQSIKKFYVGSTMHLEVRLNQHNLGKSKFTKTGIPWSLIHNIKCDNRAEAIRLAFKIKKRGIQRFLDDNGISLS